MRRRTLHELVGITLVVVGCTTDPPSLAPAPGVATGGASSGGTTGTTGGSATTAAPTGGQSSSSGGGSSATGGAPATGGASGSGAAQATGGADATGGVGDTGGVGGTGGNVAQAGTTTGSAGAGAEGGVANAGGAGPTGGTGTGGVPCPSAACDSTAQENRMCNDTDSVQLGKYQILNNLWGSRGAPEGDSQCTWTLCDENSTIAWGTEFKWTVDDIAVKSYAAAILGWHWNYIPSGIGLPIQLSEHPSIPCTWSYRVAVNAEASLNVSWDLWLYTSSSVDNLTSPTDEIMVWPYRQNKEDPIGIEDGQQDTVTIGDATWDLYRGNNGGNDVYSYLRSESANCATLNLMDFLDDLIARGWVDDSKYLISIEAGPEVVKGEGRMDTDTYSCSVE